MRHSLNTMNYEQLQPKAGNHSIDHVLIALEWSSPLNKVEIEQLRLHARPPENLYPREEPQFNIHISADLNKGGSTSVQQQELSGFIFSRFGPDGTLLRQVQITHQHCLFVASDYTNWGDFLDEANGVIAKVISALPDSAAIAAVGLQYVDKFFWRGEAHEWSLKPILNQETTYAAQHIRECVDFCHSHHGYFEDDANATYPHKRLDNVNIDVVDHAGTKVLQLLTSHKAVLNTPLKTKESVEIRQIQELLKRAHRQVLGNLLHPSVLERIGFKNLPSGGSNG